MGVCLKKRFGRKASFVFVSLVLRWWIKWGGVSCGFLCGAVRVGAEYIPIVTIVADEVGDFAESLVRYGVLLERHGSGMGGDSSGGGGDPLCVEVLVSEESSSVDESESSESDSEESDSSVVS